MWWIGVFESVCFLRKCFFTLISLISWGSGFVIDLDGINEIYFESVEILGFGFGIFRWNSLDWRVKFEFYDAVGQSLSTRPDIIGTEISKVSLKRFFILAFYWCSFWVYLWQWRDLMCFNFFSSLSAVTNNYVLCSSIIPHQMFTHLVTLSDNNDISLSNVLFTVSI